MRDTRKKRKEYRYGKYDQQTGGTLSGIGRNAQELLRKVQAAKFVEEHGDQVCPAKWQPGEETLSPSLDLVGML